MPEITSTVTFTIPGEPVSKSRHRMGLRGGKVVSYKDAKTTNAQEQVGWCYRAAAKGLSSNARDGFTVTMTFHVGKRQRRDVDNFVKLVLDGMTPLAWADDSQVTDIHAAVRHGSDDPRTEVTVETNDNLPDWRRRKCDYCGSDFRLYASTSGQRYCDGKCDYAARTRICKHCGRPFNKSSGAGGERTRYGAIYCSPECYQATRSVEVICVQCGVTFRKVKYRAGQRAVCSDDCQSAYWKEHRKTAAEGKCVDCDGPTSKKSYTRCQACAIRHRAGKRSPRSHAVIPPHL